MKLSIRSILVGWLLMALVYPAAAKEALTGKIVQFPGNGKYYEIVRIEEHPTHFEEWESAYQSSLRRSYNGVPGRLAKIDSADLQFWIMRTFEPVGITWFGLRYVCEAGLSVWADGSLLDRKDFKFWAQPWTQPGYTCAPGPYAPIALEGAQGRWTGHGIKKGGSYFLMEYDPEGFKKAREKAAAEAAAKAAAQPNAGQSEATQPDVTQPDVTPGPSEPPAGAGAESNVQAPATPMN